MCIGVQCRRWKSPTWSVDRAPNQVFPGRVNEYSLFVSYSTLSWIKPVTPFSLSQPVDQESCFHAGSRIPMWSLSERSWSSLKQPIQIRVRTDVKQRINSAISHHLLLPEHMPLIHPKSHSPSTSPPPPSPNTWPPPPPLSIPSSSSSYSQNPSPAPSLQPAPTSSH